MPDIEVAAMQVQDWGPETEAYFGAPYVYISRSSDASAPSCHIHVVIAHPSGTRYEVVAPPALSENGPYWDLSFRNTQDETAEAGLSTFRTAAPFVPGDQYEFRVSIEGSKDFNQLNIARADIVSDANGDQASVSATDVQGVDVKGAIPIGYRRWIGDMGLGHLSVSGFFQTQHQGIVSWGEQSNACAGTAYMIAVHGKRTQTTTEYQWMQKVIRPSKECNIFRMPVMKAAAMGRTYEFDLDKTQP